MIKKIVLACSMISLGISCSDDPENSTMDSPVAPSADGALGGAADSLTGGQVSAGDVMDSMTPSAGNGKTLYVKVPHLYIRKGPGMKYQPVGTIPFNQTITVQETVNKGAWFKIGEGQFVGSKYLSESKNAKAWIPAKYGH